MARKLSDEVLTLATDGTVLGFTRSKIDNASGPRATRALVTVHDLADIGFRIAVSDDDEPETDTYSYVPIRAGEAVEFQGYENLIAVKFVNQDDTTEAKVFVEYFDN